MTIEVDKIIDPIPASDGAGVKLKRSMNSTDKIAKPKQRKSTITSTRPVTKKRPQPTPRISGSHLTPLPKIPLSKHSSGR